MGSAQLRSSALRLPNGMIESCSHMWWVAMTWYFNVFKKALKK